MEFSLATPIPRIVSFLFFVFLAMYGGNFTMLSNSSVYQQGYDDYSYFNEQIDAKEGYPQKAKAISDLINTLTAASEEVKQAINTEKMADKKPEIPGEYEMPSIPAC